jgi:hypothetical protein
MTRSSRRGAARAALTRDARAIPCGATARCSPGMLTLDELLAEPMVQQLMCRDRTDELAVRRLWEHVAASRPAQTPRRCMPPLPVAPDELGHTFSTKLPSYGAGGARERCVPGFPI